MVSQNYESEYFSNFNEVSIQYSNTEWYTGKISVDNNSNTRGYGVFHYTNGDEYEGSFENGVRNGLGEYRYNKNKASYIGQWKNDKKEGFGSYKFENYEFEGKWEMNEPTEVFIFSILENEKNRVEKSSSPSKIQVNSNYINTESYKVLSLESQEYFNSLLKQNNENDEFKIELIAIIHGNKIFAFNVLDEAQEESEDNEINKINNLIQKAFDLPDYSSNNYNYNSPIRNISELDNEETINNMTVKSNYNPLNVNYTNNTSNSKNTAQLENELSEIKKNMANEVKQFNLDLSNLKYKGKENSNTLISYTLEEDEEGGAARQESEKNKKLTIHSTFDFESNTEEKNDLVVSNSSNMINFGEEQESTIRGNNRNVSIISNMNLTNTTSNLDNRDSNLNEKIEKEI